MSSATNRLTRKLDEYQSSDQAGFRKRHSTVENFQTLQTLKEKCNEYNTPLYLAFIDFNKAFDSVELWAIIRGLNNARIDSRYTNLLKRYTKRRPSQLKCKKM